MKDRSALWAGVLGALPLLLAWTVGAGAQDVQRPGDGADGWTVLRGATVVDGTGAPPAEDALVGVRDGRIRFVAREGERPMPDHARVLDVEGKYLVPGLVDAHAHVAFGPVVMERESPVPRIRMDYDDRASRQMLRTLLAFGITSVRNPGGPTAEAVALRERQRTGEIPGPRIRTAGALLDVVEAPGLAVDVGTPDEVRSAVTRQDSAGVDFVKLYVGLSPELSRAAVQEAHERGIEVLGHFCRTSWTEAARMSVDGVVHIWPCSPSLLPLDRRKPYLDAFTGTQVMYRWFELVDLNAPQLLEAVDALARNDVLVDPTLVMWEAMYRGGDTIYRSRPELGLAPSSLVESWREEFTLTMEWTPEDYRRARETWPKVLRLAKLLHDRGVTLAAGTDVPNPWVVPGTSFHRELELLAKAGIPPAEVLRIATRNGAEAAGLLDEVGTVVAGKRADLVLLASNPLEDISATREIEWVMQGGRILRPERLLPGRSRSPDLAPSADVPRPPAHPPEHRLERR